MKKKMLSIVFCTILMIPVISTIASANQPPSAPEIEGPTSGKAGVQLNYGFCSSDPDGDDVTICIDWGDGSGEVCIGPFSSGVCAQASHTWADQGTITIKAKSSDGQAESDWSTLDVSIPRVRANHALFLQWFFNQFPHAFPILRHILGL